MQSRKRQGRLVAVYGQFLALRTFKNLSVAAARIIFSTHQVSLNAENEGADSILAFLKLSDWKV